MKLKKPLIQCSIKSNLHERYIFNFRIKPEILATKLPVSWLRPQIINDWSVVSFCILDIKKLTVVPIPNIFNYQTISCAYRIGVVDTSLKAETPSVYITDRNADLSLITKLSPFLLADAIPYVKASISHEKELVRIQCNYADGQGLFSAEATPGELKSQMFSSVEDFKIFIKNGVSSYTPSIYPNNMARVDLHKSDTAYTAMVGEVEFSWLDGVWKDAGLQLDSIIRATGGEYKWTYRGLASYE
ncbi:hypothetical protein SAMN05518672_10455 [Chitinophaga sp. CF118]|uniref:hypothetical protein n=1 Tax=Chitinophaga sp. CF118 TaxID=1884367 RepID=UPI0008F40000|nr:hypothetical protein [Chitinophaga sp. CF118]SFD98883.1 hypothetical protein SAMN05518672_10455 [Chitinophaga sp. CF118]